MVSIYPPAARLARHGTCFVFFRLNRSWSSVNIEGVVASASSISGLADSISIRRETDISLPVPRRIGASGDPIAAGRVTGMSDAPAPPPDDPPLKPREPVWREFARAPLV